MNRAAAETSTFNPFQLDDLLFSSLPGRLRRPLNSLLERTLGLTALAEGYRQLPRGLSSLAFANATLNHLNVEPRVVSGSINHIPASGPVVVVANHPFGGVEGVILARMLQQLRPDVRIMANRMLQRIPELSETFVGVNPYGGSQARLENIRPLREALRWLKNGGLLVVFPAGDVSRLHPLEGVVRDGKWDAGIVRMIRRSGAPVVPIHFAGQNSRWFNTLGLLHPLLRSAMLPRELLNKRGSRIALHIGTKIESVKLDAFTGDDEAARYLRLHTCLLGRERDGDERRESHVLSSDSEMVPVSGAVCPDLLAMEVQALPQTQCLAESGDMQVYYARAEQVSWVVQEIGRLREVTFRAVGEGTGKASDIDIYDSYYLHLFIWNRATREVVGAYRLGLADEILSRFGKRGLYSHSLFSYSRRLLRAINPAIELGRSFVRIEYQRSFTPLMLLWKGIGQFVVRHPHYRVLFGPVSISNDYTPTSQQLLIDFLSANNFDDTLGRLIRPRSPYRPSLKPVWRRADLAGLCGIDNVSELVALQERGEKGVPILIKQYLKLGGRMLGFNVDKAFSDCIDGLILVDLRQTEPRVLQKYMGREGAEQFLAQQHGGEAKRAG